MVLLEQPTIAIGTAKEYAYWEVRVRQFLHERGAPPDELERVDARYNFSDRRITLYRLANPSQELSVAETISHEMIHALLDQMGEHLAARAVDLVGKPVGHPARTGGI
jgi:hypothetical protein